MSAEELATCPRCGELVGDGDFGRLCGDCIECPARDVREAEDMTEGEDE